MVALSPSPSPRTVPGAAVAAVRLEQVVKRFGGETGKRVAASTGGQAVEGQVTAVDGIDLDIADGEFFSMLGPSGSGKTTTLRMIAGFELPTSGRILLHGEDVSNKPPFERDVNTVFQDYALFPHMTVGDNVGYGLMIRKVAKAEREKRVGEALEMVRLTGYERRRPSQLSGGQRQRVALARALVNRPRVLLLDEPLGALDLKLREEMQIELKAIQQEVGITFIYVTHDQEEAMTMSNRIAVMNRGQYEQLGDPESLYERPTTRFVAGFLGVSNLLPATIAGQADGYVLAQLGDDARIRVPRGLVNGHDTIEVASGPRRSGCTRRPRTSRRAPTSSRARSSTPRTSGSRRPTWSSRGRGRGWSSTSRTWNGPTTALCIGRGKRSDCHGRRITRSW